ncbi:MAG: hypothetical protein ABR909_14230 [Candidatus Bathyarchaeia archaeon]|jgi:hypothetical protein
MSNQQDSANSTNMKSLELIKSRQESEATLNWSRNSYFLVVLSLLTLAYSQNPVSNLTQLTFYKIMISSAGVFLSIVWLLIQQRSSQYIEYYKNQANNLSKDTQTPEFYPKELKGIEMRKLVYCLPIAFIVLLSLFIISQIIFFYYPSGINLFLVV